MLILMAENNVPDLTGLPTPICPNCNSDWFMAPVRVDPRDYSIVMWGVQASCFSCKTKVTMATPADFPKEWITYEESDGYDF